MAVAAQPLREKEDGAPHFGKQLKGAEEEIYLWIWPRVPHPLVDLQRRYGWCWYCSCELLTH